MNRFLEFVLYVFLVDDEFFFFHLRNVERNVFQKFFEYRVQSSCADVFRLFVHNIGNRCKLVDCAFGKFHFDSFRFQQSLVLLDQSVFRLRKNFYEILFRQAVKRNANREAPLKFRNQVRSALRYGMRLRR